MDEPPSVNERLEFEKYLEEGQPLAITVERRKIYKKLR